MLEYMLSFLNSWFANPSALGIGLAIAFGAIWFAPYWTPILKKPWAWAVRRQRFFELGSRCLYSNSSPDLDRSGTESLLEPGSSYTLGPTYRDASHTPQRAGSGRVKARAGGCLLVA